MVEVVDEKIVGKFSFKRVDKKYIYLKEKEGIPVFVMMAVIWYGGFFLSSFFISGTPVTVTKIIIATILFALFKLFSKNERKVKHDKVYISSGKLYYKANSKIIIEVSIGIIDLELVKSFITGDEPG